MRGKIFPILSLLFLFLASSCSYRPCGSAYQEYYAYLKTDLKHAKPLEESDYFLVILVDARHLDYSDNRSLFQTMAKHPSDGSKNGDVGHAWICLRGVMDGVPVEIEGGHSGELGTLQAKYFEGVMDCIEKGQENPIRYMWATQRDGFFQEGSGGHRPTFAAKISITEEQFWEMIAFMDPGNYHYEAYQLTGKQCSSFVVQTAALAGVEIAGNVTVQIDQAITVGKESYTLWCDPKYSSITFSSPDAIESCLIKAVSEGRMECALDWYRKTHPVPIKQKLTKCWETIYRFPERIQRVKTMNAER